MGERRWTSPGSTRDALTLTALSNLALSVVTVVAVATAGCKPHADDTSVHLNGRLEAPMLDLAPKVSGRVVEVLVREGDHVQKGDLLIRLDLGETAVAVERDRHALQSTEARLSDLMAGNRKAEIMAAEAELIDRKAAVDLAKRELERQQVLLARKAGSRSDHDRARTTLERAEANLQMSTERLALVREGFRAGQKEQAARDVERARSVLTQSEIVARESELRAPAAGVILHRIAEPGLLLLAGQPGLVMAFADRLYVRAFVPEAKLGIVRPGMPASVTVDAHRGRSFPAHVTEISSDAEFTPKPVETRGERVNLVYAAKIDLDAGWKEPLVPGQPANVDVPISAPHAP
jgi:HlyD family secretion protein